MSNRPLFDDDEWSNLFLLIALSCLIGGPVIILLSLFLRPVLN